MSQLEKLGVLSAVTGFYDRNTRVWTVRTAQYVGYGFSIREAMENLLDVVRLSVN